MRKVILVSCAALALAACGKTPPPRRAGLWSETIVRDGHAVEMGLVGSVKVCLAPTTDAQSPIFSYASAERRSKARHCTSTSASRRLDGVYTFGSTCPLPGVNNGVLTTKGQASGDFISRYHLRIESVIVRPAPFMALNSDHVDEIDGEWLGPCPANMEARGHGFFCPMARCLPTRPNDRSTPRSPHVALTKGCVPDGGVRPAAPIRPTDRGSERPSGTMRSWRR